MIGRLEDGPMAERGVSSKRSSGVRRPDVASTAPSVSFYQLTKDSVVPERWTNENNFSITRLQSPFGIQNSIMKASRVKAMLVTVSLRSIPLGRYQLWADAKPLPTSYVPAFRTNVFDFDTAPTCWSGSPFDFIHYHIPRSDLDDIAEDWELGPICDYKQSVIEDDLVLAQLTKNILPSITKDNKPYSLGLDQFQLVLGAHLLQRYGGISRVHAPAVGGLAVWQKRRALELLRESLDGSVRLADLAKECGLSVSHFARSFKAAFGISSHQWLIRQRIDRAKELLSQTNRPLIDVAAQSGFGDQAAFTRTFHRVAGASPGRWRREHHSR
jgi:AraC family transcriptional regulator